MTSSPSPKMDDSGMKLSQELIEEWYAHPNHALNNIAVGGFKALCKLALRQDSSGGMGDSDEARIKTALLHLRCPDPDKPMTAEPGAPENSSAANALQHQGSRVSEVNERAKAGSIPAGGATPEPSVDYARGLDDGLTVRQVSTGFLIKADNGSDLFLSNERVLSLKINAVTVDATHRGGIATPASAAPEPYDYLSAEYARGLAEGLEDAAKAVENFPTLAAKFLLPSVAAAIRAKIKPARGGVDGTRRARQIRKDDRHVSEAHPTRAARRSGGDC